MDFGDELSKIHSTINSRMHELDRSGVSSSSHASDRAAENSSLLKNRMHTKVSKYKDAFRNRSITVDVLSIFFGLGTWIGINSTYVQLPLLVENAPEGWSLPSYLVLIIQLGNIGPLLYTVLQKFAPNGKIKDPHLIFAVLLIGTIAAIMMSFFYTETAEINGQKHSVSLFIIVFFLALTGCTSTVLFMPYMGRFPETYLIVFFIGEGLSGFLPSVVALIQGVGGNAECIPTNSTAGPEFERYVPPPRFGTETFFLFVFAMMICATIAFFLLDYLKVCKKQYAAVKISNGNNYEYDEPDTKTKHGKVVVPQILSKCNYRLLLFLMAAVCLFGNGVFPSLQSYSCLPYGNVAYHLAVSLSSMANPIACFLAIFLPHTSFRSIGIMLACGSIFTCYALATAYLSPVPPLIGTTIGEIMVIFCWTILMGLVSYIKLCITTVMRSQGGKSLVWVGALGQAGSAVGSIITFVLVNVFNLFESYQPC